MLWGVFCGWKEQILGEEVYLVEVLFVFICPVGEERWSGERKKNCGASSVLWKGGADFRGSNCA